MFPVISSLFHSIRQGLLTRAELQAEIPSGIGSLSFRELIEVAPAERTRPAPVGLALTTLDWLAICSGDRQA
jgi:hypothetical protein